MWDGTRRMFFVARGGSNQATFTVAYPDAGVDGDGDRRCKSGERIWMDVDAPTEEALTVLAPYPADLMEAFAVSTAVNAPKRDAPDLIEPAESSHRRNQLEGRTDSPAD